ncbi:transcriptional regulator [Mucilaginibacter sp. PPCGB 2223]|uniref:ArsR/SmtB family transcription factor n=1 Tax=Mucilaginibacter sp. PPCGB 2223 TaxID=1886027 RepID=UPI0008254D6A|nr:metalloregulator ArsR/SmtB family transcription factor [Mucilaginibacter sp. PPCGB 2223]OCX53720.1 transcriptional regulator [Mucilaginibacter sp. PPCGB 2223]
MDLKQAERISKALADPYRLRIIEAVQSKGDWFPYTTVLGMLNLAQSTISHHIRQLTDTGLLLAQKQGRNSSYKVNKELFTAYISYLNRFKE